MKFRIYRQILLVGLILGIAPLAAYADQVTVNAMVDKDTAVIGDTITLIVTISGTQSAPQPDLPVSKDFAVKYFGSSSQITILNGAMNTSVKHTYILKPFREGTFTVGPARIDFDGHRFKSQPIQIQVLSTHPKPTAVEEKSDEVFLKAVVSSDSPYVNQQIVYTIQLWHKVEVDKANLILPGFIGFFSENLGKQHESQKMANGIAYTVTELKTALFPNHAGKTIIDPANAECVVVPNSKKGRQGAFGGSMLANPFQASASGQAAQTLLLHSNPVEVMVKPLPLKGRPENFVPLVGQVDLTAKISKDSLKMGGYTTLTLDISGNANIQDIQISNSKGLEDFKIYDEKPIGSTSGQEELIGRKVFRKAFVPLKTGNFQIPEFEIPFFNPKTSKYETAHSKAFLIEALPAAESESLHALVAPGSAVQKDFIRILGKDILPVYTDLDALQSHKHGQWRYVIYSLWLIMPVIAFLIISYVRVHKEAIEKDADLYRRRNAYKRASKNMAVAASLLQEKDGRKFYVKLSKLLKEYLGDKLLLPGGSLTPQEAEAKLKANGVDTQMSYKVRMLMEYCELCQFAASLVREVHPKSTYNSAKNLLEQLEKVLQDEPLQSA